MIRILRIIASVDPRHGGPVEGIKQQVPFRSQADFLEHVVTLDDPDEPFVRDFPLKVFGCGRPSKTVTGWRSRLPWARFGYQPDFIPWLRAHIHDYDLVVVHGLWNFSTMGARVVLVGSGVPYIVFTHGMLDPWFNRTARLKAAVKQLFWWFNEGPLVNGARYVLFTSEEEKILARHSFWPYRARERVIAYGTANRVGDVAAETEAFARILPGLTKPYLLFLSRIHVKKGCDLLVEAFADVAAAHPDLDLVLAGPDKDNLRPALEAVARARGIADRIHWPGMLSGDAKWGAYRGAAAFILPSHQENFGIVVAEAMACSTPVLTTDKVNIWREVKACGGGVIEPDDLAGIKCLLTTFLGLSPDERAEMGHHAREGFLQYFEAGKAVETIDAAFRDAVA